jgi:predicted RNA-binding Zn ribbon-like protein
MTTASSERPGGGDVPSKPGRPLKYVSGDPGPDLVNTIDWTRDGVASERLTDYQRLTRWAEGAGVLSRAEARALREAARSRPEAAAEALEVARRLRRVLQGVLASVALRQRDERAWQEFGAYVEDALGRLVVVPGPAGRKNRRAATWKWRDADERLDWFLWPVVRSTAELLTSDEAHRIRVCDGDDCGWMFVDRSRNRLRRWCEMRTCGTAAKSRRRRDRHRGELLTSDEGVLIDM